VRLCSPSSKNSRRPSSVFLVEMAKNFKTTNAKCANAPYIEYKAICYTYKQEPLVQWEKLLTETMLIFGLGLIATSIGWVVNSAIRYRDTKKNAEEAKREREQELERVKQEREQELRRMESEREKERERLAMERKEAEKKERRAFLFDKLINPKYQKDIRLKAYEEYKELGGNGWVDYYIQSEFPTASPG
jgi:hypothetical protein